MGGIVGGLHVDHDALARHGSMREISAVEIPVHPPEFPFADRVFEPRKRWLTGQIRFAIRHPPRGDLERRIAAQKVGIVAVLVAASDLIDPLAQSLNGKVAHLGRIAPVGQTGRQPGHQVQPLVYLAHDEHPRVAGQIAAVEIDQHRGGEDTAEADFRATVCHRASLPEGC